MGRPWIDFSCPYAYIKTMEIENLSTAMSQDKLREEAAAKVQSMALQQAEAEAAELAKLMEGAEVVTDTTVGNNVDLLG
jgi:transcription elongation GreA/GreB family factor